MHKFVNPKHNDPEEPPEIPDEEQKINKIRKTNFQIVQDFRQSNRIDLNW